MTLSIVIQHHPSRPLSGALRRYEVIDDPEPDALPSAIRTYLACLDLPPEVDHRLVLQDDVELCDDFERRVEERIRERPEAVIAFFTPGMNLHGRLLRAAHAEGERWVALPRSANWAPAVATCWPKAAALDFARFASEHVARRRARGLHTTGDDPVIGAWARDRKETIWATVPCLVEHPDVGVSLVKKRAYDGTNPARKAAVFLRPSDEGPTMLPNIG